MNKRTNAAAIEKRPQGNVLQANLITKPDTFNTLSDHRQLKPTQSMGTKQGLVTQKTLDLRSLQI